MTLREISYETFQEYSAKYPESSFVQTAPMAKLRKELGNEVYLLGFFENEELRGAGLFYLRTLLGPFKACECHQGPLVDYSDASFLKELTTELIRFFKPKHVVTLRILPSFYVRERDKDANLVEGGFNHMDYVENLKRAGFTHQGFTDDPKDMLTRWYFVKDLRDIHTEDELLMSFIQQKRWSLKQALKVGVDVREMSYDDLEDFSLVMDDTSARHEFQHRPLKYYQSLYKNLTDYGMLKLYGAYLNLDDYEETLNKQDQEYTDEIEWATKELETKPNSKKLVERIETAKRKKGNIEKDRLFLEEMRKDGDEHLLSASMFVHWNKEMTYLFSGAHSKYMAFQSPYVLQWKAMRKALELGVERYNFYGTRGRFSGNEDEGVYNFKKGFGGALCEQAGSFTLTVNPTMNTLYELARKLKRIVKR
ncbi:peptidoglycan bridge formation glycyltransferase FemA/FemB family protein [Guggenheimella bovis]